MGITVVMEDSWLTPLNTSKIRASIRAKTTLMWVELRHVKLWRDVLGAYLVMKIVKVVIFCSRLW